MKQQQQRRKKKKGIDMYMNGFGMVRISKKAVHNLSQPVRCTKNGDRPLSGNDLQANCKHLKWETKATDSIEFTPNTICSHVP